MSLKNHLSRLTSPKIGPSVRPIGPPDSGLEGLPDFVEPLLGWRTWKVWTPSPDPDCCPYFSSVILDTPWTPRRKVSAEHSFDLGAKCLGLLELECSCGVYAFTDPAGAFRYLTRVRDRLAGVSVEVALGTVSLWGRVIECERGYKAQFAYPHHIYLPASFAKYLLQVRLSFAVPVGIYDSTCEEEISLMVFSGLASQKKRKLRLKNSGLLRDRTLPAAIGFYDLAPLPPAGNPLPMACPDFSVPDSVFPDELGDAPRS